MGLWQGGTGICCLPGSHMKTIRVGEDGRITAFRTSLTGEMIFALSQDTILKHAVELDAPMDPAYLLMGYDHCERLGLSQTLFKVRLLDTQLHASRAGIYSFFLGAVLWEDVSRLIADAPAKVVIGGKRQLREAMALLLQSRSRIEVIGVTEALVAASTALGAVRIYEYGKNQREESPKNK